MKRTILLVGGAGYIGSHTAYLLKKQNYRVIVLDQCDTAVERISCDVFVVGDYGNALLLQKIFSTYRIDAVMHFASFIEVGLSVKDPARFYDNNVTKTLTLLDVMRAAQCSTLIFSSSCAIYGAPKYLPLDEQHMYDPLSPYGKTKLAVEFILSDYAAAYGLRYVSLRYFNAAGALWSAGLGERHEPETHVIPLLLQAMLNGNPFVVMGADYQTPDGTCVRDYIHVLDIAVAHLLAYDYLCAGKKSDVFNIGSGTGYSVKQLLASAQRVTGLVAQVTYGVARAGDVPVLVAQAAKAEYVLGWKPVYSSLDHILESAWAWELRKRDLLYVPFHQSEKQAAV